MLDAELLYLGFLMVLLGILLLILYPFMGSPKGDQEDHEEKTEAAGIVMIGPLPIFIGKNVDRNLVFLLIILMVILMIFGLLLSLPTIGRLVS